MALSAWDQGNLCEKYLAGGFLREWSREQE